MLVTANNYISEQNLRQLVDVPKINVTMSLTKIFQLVANSTILNKTPLHFGLR
jgi:hypothetical protein